MAHIPHTLPTLAAGAATTPVLFHPSSQNERRGPRSTLSSRRAIAGGGQDLDRHRICQSAQRWARLLLHESAACGPMASSMGPLEIFHHADMAAPASLDQKRLPISGAASRGRVLFSRPRLVEVAQIWLVLES